MSVQSLLSLGNNLLMLLAGSKLGNELARGPMMLDRSSVMTPICCPVCDIPHKVPASRR